MTCYTSVKIHSPHSLFHYTKTFMAVSNCSAFCASVVCCRHAKERRRRPGLWAGCIPLPLKHPQLHSIPLLILILPLPLLFGTMASQAEALQTF